MRFDQIERRECRQRRLTPVGCAKLGSSDDHDDGRGWISRWSGSHELSNQRRAVGVVRSQGVLAKAASNAPQLTAWTLRTAVSTRLNSPGTGRGSLPENCSPPVPEQASLIFIAIVSERKVWRYVEFSELCELLDVF